LAAVSRRDELCFSQAALKLKIGDDAMPDSPTSIKFHYIKAPSFRVIHADGIIGSVTPRGLLHFAFYSERPAIPTMQQHEISADGRLSEPQISEARDGIVRELDVDVMMAKANAIELRDWLNDRILEIEDIEKKIKEMQGGK
jgi:hypothetical protein